MKKYNSDLEQVDAAWKKLEPMLDKDKRPLKLIKVFAVAAAVLLISTVGLLFWQNHNGAIVYHTKFGETAKVILPDSSVIVLNGNTQLSVPKNWPERGDRQVQIDGEAYFSIKHTKTNQKFFVHMNNHSSVEVLGTEFNISKRQKETKVVLNSGKIAFHIDEKDHNSQVISMKPGDLVEYQNQNQSYIKKVVDPEVYSSWKSSHLVFENTTLKEVMQILQDTYGLQIRVEKPQLLNVKISGSAPTKNVDLLLGGLSQIFELKFTKKGQIIMITTN